MRLGSCKKILGKIFFSRILRILLLVIDSEKKDAFFARIEPEFINVDDAETFKSSIIVTIPALSNSSDSNEVFPYE